MQCKKTILITIFSLIVLLFSMNMVSAAACVSAEAYNITSLTQTAPATSATISGSSVTVSNTYIGNSSTNVTFYISNSSGTYVIGADTTVTACNDTASITFVSTTYADGTAYRFNASAYNTTTVTASSTATTSVTIDNTAPTACTVTLSRNTLHGGAEIISECSGTDAIDTSLSFVQNMTDPFSTEVSGSSSSSATYVQSNFVPVGTYRTFCYCSDNGNNVREGNVTLQKFSEDKPLTTGTGDALPSKIPTRMKTTLLGFGIFVLIAVVAVGVILMQSSGRKR